MYACIPTCVYIHAACVYIHACIYIVLIHIYIYIYTYTYTCTYTSTSTSTSTYTYTYKHLICILPAAASCGFPTPLTWRRGGSLEPAIAPPFLPWPVVWWQGKPWFACRLSRDTKERDAPRSGIYSSCHTERIDTLSRTYHTDPPKVTSVCWLTFTRNPYNNMRNDGRH